MVKAGKFGRPVEIGHLVSMEFYYSSVKKLSLLPLFTLLVCQLICCDLSGGSLVNLYGQFSWRSVLQTIFLFLC